MSTLGFERGTGFMKLQTELGVALESLVADAADIGALDVPKVSDRSWANFEQMCSRCGR